MSSRDPKIDRRLQLYCKLNSQLKYTVIDFTNIYLEAKNLKNISNNEQIVKNLIANSKIHLSEGNIPTDEIPHWTKGMQANADFFGHKSYGEKYLKSQNRSVL